MKIFDAHFFSGTFLTGLGILSFVVGVLSLLPPAQYNLVMSVLLVLLGIVLVVYGRKRAKAAPPAASKIAVKTLRNAGLLDNKRKK